MWNLFSGKHPQLRQLWLNHHRHLQSRRHLMDQATAVRKALGVTGVATNVNYDITIGQKLIDITGGISSCHLLFLCSANIC